MTPIFGEGNFFFFFFFWKLGIVVCLHNQRKLLYLAQLSSIFEKKNSKIQNGRHSGEWDIRWNLEWLVFTDTLRIKNFAEITLSRTVYEIQAFLCFAIFVKNFEIQNGRHFWRDKFFWKIGSATQQIYPVGQKNLSKSLYLAWFSRYKHFVLCIFEKKLKISNNRLFWWVKNSLKLGKASLHRSPVDQKVLARSLYVALFSRYKNFCDFCEKFENSKWVPFLAVQNIFENGVTYSRATLWVKNFVKITLSSTVFKIQAFLCFAFLKKIWKFKMATIFGKWNIFWDLEG